MKKIVSLIFVALLVITLAACTDKKYYDDTVNIIFFTANRNATLVEPILGVEPGDLIEEPEEPTRLGYIFNGWYKNQQATIPWNFDVDTVPEVSTTIFAGWIALQYNINYDLNGGEMIQASYATTYFTDTNVVLPTARREGFEFLAWYTYDWVDQTSTKPGDSGLQAVPAGIIGDITLYAHYRPAKVDVIFRVNFPVNGQGPAVPNSQNIAYGSVINFPVLPTTAGYVFIGWNSRADGLGVWYVNDEIFTRSQRTTIYAQWQPAN